MLALYLVISLARIMSNSACMLSKGSGTIQLATTIKDNRIPQLTAVAQFMTRDKSQPLSNPVTVKLVSGQTIGMKA